MSGIGHNGGPALQPGHAFRRLAWTKARAALLPQLPVEVVRLRVKRAVELGLDYRTYAGIRATTGHDLVAFLFSTNALRMLREGQADAAREAKLAAAQVQKALAVQPPLPLTAADGLAFTPDRIAAAPGLIAMPHLRDRLREMTAGWPADRVLLISETMAEREWLSLGRFAGCIPAGRYFADDCRA